MKKLKKWLNYKTFHILSLIAILCVMLIASLAYIDHETAYIEAFNNKPIMIGKCWYRDNFGIECPSCGLTRSFISIENFNLKQAFSYNRIGFFVYLLMIFILILNIMGIKEAKLTSKFGKFVAIYGFSVCVALVINWVIEHFVL